MLKIKVPATTSNLAVGFDVLGMALNLYNIFQFEASDSFGLVGFDDNQIETNLVLQTYFDFCEDKGVTDPLPVVITQIEQGIPIARGLGSSATCIIAAIYAANRLNEINASQDECIRYCSEYEGHPDNVFSAIYGGLNATFTDEETYHNQKIPVSGTLHFAILIPDNVGKTEELRFILPTKVSLKDAVYHMGRMVQFPTAMQEGKFELLKSILKDRLHQEHRGKYIKSYREIMKIAEEHDIICTISGSGPSLFLISRGTDFSIFDQYSEQYKCINVEISEGMEIIDTEQE